MGNSRAEFLRQGHACHVWGASSKASGAGAEGVNITSVKDKVRELTGVELTKALDLH